MKPQSIIFHRKAAVNLKIKTQTANMNLIQTRSVGAAVGFQRHSVVFPLKYAKERKNKRVPKVQGVSEVCRRAPPENFLL